MYRKSIQQIVLIWIVAAFLLVGINLQAAGAADSTASPQGQEEETLMQKLKRKTGELFDGNEKPASDQPETPAKTESPPEKPADKKLSERSPALSKFKKKMQKRSDDLGKTIDRDKKTLKKKMNKMFGEDGQ